MLKTTKLIEADRQTNTENPKANRETNFEQYETNQN